MTDTLMMLAAGFFGGMLNAVAGGGTFITFPALVASGVPVVMANATSTVAALPGYLAAAIGFRHDIAKIERHLVIRLTLWTLLGGLVDLVLRSFGNPDRWNAQLVANAQAISRRHPTAIHPNFAATENAVEMTLRHPLADANQKVVETLALLFFRDHQMGDRIVTGAVHFAIYCPRFTSRFARDSEPSDRLPRAKSATVTRQAPKSHLRELHKPDQRKTTG